MFCEKVVIVSDLDWVYETLDGKDCIIKVNQNNLENIKEAIIKIIRDKNSRKEYLKMHEVATLFDYYINMKKMESIMISEIKIMEVRNLTIGLILSIIISIFMSTAEIKNFRILEITRNKNE